MRKFQFVLTPAKATVGLMAALVAQTVAPAAPARCVQGTIRRKFC